LLFKYCRVIFGGIMLLLIWQLAASLDEKNKARNMKKKKSRTCEMKL